MSDFSWLLSGVVIGYLARHFLVSEVLKLEKTLTKGGDHMSDNPTIPQPAPLHHPWRPWAWRDVYASWMPGGRLRYWEAEVYGAERPGSPHTSSYVRVRPVLDLLQRRVEIVTVAAYRGYWDAASSESVGVDGVDGVVLRAVKELGLA